MQKRWTHKLPSDPSIIESISTAINVNKTLSGILAQRGITQFESAKKFFRPQFTDLHDPFVMKGMNEAIIRIDLAIAKGEKILIYGDYDVDGTTSVAVVYSFLTKRYSNIDFYIPDRYTEGYGVSFISIDWASNNGFSLIIALDCGIKAVDKVKYAKGKGVDFIVCDHHLPGDEVPEAVAILNPKQGDCPYPFKELSGCGIGFKLIQAYALKHGIAFAEIEQYLDLVAVSVAADLVPILDENRILVHHGLKKLKSNPNPGLRALLEAYAPKPEFSVSDIVFFIGPRINAAGRIADAKDSVRLMIADDYSKAKQIAELVNQHNIERRGFDLSITEQAFEMVEKDDSFAQRKSTVLFHNEWHKGVIGIVASRLIEKYYRPTIVLTESNGMATGSARSVDGFDLYHAIEACADLLEQYGGHTHAAGLTLKLDKVKPFAEKFEQVVASNIQERSLTPEIEYDASIALRTITPKFFSVLKQFSPFGPGNPNPVFMSKHVWDVGDVTIVGNNHLKMSLTQEEGGRIFKAIAFGLGEHYDKVAQGISFDICYTIEENHFNGHVNLQLNIKDILFKN
ncbi:MAG: single-stranded-DNA-specific exonuclease RecJ [Bacteroidia bacterium]|jgi:single-stranded-DNA-specific exonuclease|nr:single-stranded-DNA-specific exonuclease RecJ [Bacteroidia bacterium]